MNLDKINPRLVAGKLAAAEMLEEPELNRELAENPRLIELIWFIQWRSTQPGGIGKLASDLIEAFPDRFVSSSMNKVGTPQEDGRYSLEECWQLWGQDYANLRPGIVELVQRSKEWSDEYEKFLCCVYDPEYETAAEFLKVFNGDKMQKAFREFNFGFLTNNRHYIAKSELPKLLEDFCISHDSFSYLVARASRYCQDVVKLIFDYMDLHAKRAGIGQGLAPTEVTAKVFDGLEYAWAERVLIRVDGNSRFGKSESARAWCAMYPGKARLVTLHNSNSQRELIQIFAEALGFTTFSNKIIEDVYYTLRHGRLGFIIDESHFLISRDSTCRLDWFRTRVVDQKLPCAILTTPGNFDPLIHRCEKAMGYKYLAQFLGRISRTVKLPEELKEDSLFSVARFHFPTFGESRLKTIVGASLKSDSYLKAVEDIARLARWFCQRRQAKAISQEDLDQAIAEVVPNAAPLNPPMATTTTAKPPIRPKTAKPARTGRSATAAVTRGTDFSIQRQSSGTHLVPA